jgi:integrase
LLRHIPSEAQITGTAREEREIRLPDTKNDEGRVVPIAGELVSIMERLRESRRVTCADGSVALAETVFHDSGRPITKKRFVRACAASRKAAGLAHRIFHDFRRAAARRMTNAGVPQVVAMGVTGHKTASMYRPYSIVEKADMARGLETVARREETARVRRIR